MTQRENDPPTLSKCDVNKTSNYETIESVTFREANAFEKMPKESLAIENFPLQQLDFPSIQQCSFFL